MSKKIIKDLTLIDATSSNERPVFDYLKANMVNYDKQYSDNIGSFITKYSGKKEGLNVAVVAHMDEIGFMVKSITKEGFIKVMNIGGIVPEVCLSSQVKLTTRDLKVLDGVFLVPAPHSNSKDKFTIDKLVVDFGFKDKEDAFNHNVCVGDMITFKTEYNELPNNKIISKALDNRLGCAIITELDNEFKDLEFGNVYLCASVQEEVGLRGAQTLLHAIDDKIDYVMVVDVSPVEDAFSEKDIKIGNGCLLRVKDPRTVLDYNELDVIRRLAKNNNIKYQEYFSKGGTDANQLQVQKDGHVTSAICIGGRNLHTSSSLISYDDYVGCRELIKLYILEKLKG